MWSYGSGVYDDDTLNIVGFDVEATDGSIGSVDEAQHEVGSRYIVVDTGPWIFGSKHVLPAGTVVRIDPQERKVYLARTKQEIKDAPKYDKDTYRDSSYREELGTYYGRYPSM
ncbi:PRC-barrel domain containing protein [Nonomuraea typhae]|uniref:PRC-barrel domain containing protein n=1 Tax=Nonomuraea typhae TaxID=2603600 RepID=UPI0012F7561B|nr:PRC-barrel domain containing protein [Nonomuraea typhae]